MGNKLFWNTVKLLLSEKVAGKYEMHLIESNEPVKTHQETLEVLNNFFSSIVQNLGISRYSNDEPLVSYTNDVTLEVFLQCRNHPAIWHKCNGKDSFSFIEIDQKQIQLEILKLHVIKHHKAPTFQ